MISLTHEYTDGKGRHARGWLFYDAECTFCTRIARWVAGSLQRRGLGVAPLQDPRVGTLLGMSRGELFRELRFLDEDGFLHGGANALLAVAREFVWARPLLWLSRIPGMEATLDAAYRWVAEQRNCHSLQCSVAEVPRR
jgi:predicted DCC family thiol-disulfide oxidoreductase YuxK